MGNRSHKAKSKEPSPPEKVEAIDSANKVSPLLKKEEEKSEKKDKTFTSKGGAIRASISPQIENVLNEVPLLARLTDEERKTLVSKFQERHYYESETIIKQGDFGHEFFILMDGKVKVSKKSDNSDKEVTLLTLTAGDYFGERALLENDRRAATVTVIDGSAIVLVCNRQQFVELFGQTKMRFAKRCAISDKPLRADQLGSISESAKIDSNRLKTEEVRELLKAAVQKNVLFKNLDETQLGLIVDEMIRAEVPTGTEIIKQGEAGEHFIVVETGNFEIFVKKKGQPENKVASRGPCSSFGELALMYNSPRAATVRAETDSIVWQVDRLAFKRIIMKVSNQKLKEIENFLRCVEILQILSNMERAKIAQALEERVYDNNTLIVRQGDPGDKMFFVRSGQAEAAIFSDNMTEPKVVATYVAGQYFGERALLKNEPRAASVRATSSMCKCLVLYRKDFVELLGPLEDILGVDYSKKKQEEDSKEDQDEAERIKIRMLNDVSNKDLEIIGTLGKGSFGHVHLVKGPDNKTYASKAVNKARIAFLGQQDHILNEKRVMLELDSPFIVKLYSTFKDKDTLYFLMEACLGGELFSILRAGTVFKEETARFYAACVICAFEHMHKKNLVYRDLKPENLLLDHKGYLKLTDFGFAKRVPDRTWTLCGTPDYLAPEVVSGQGHGKPVDWWTLGILIYEMLASYPPFYDDDPMRTYAKIMHGQIAFPKHFSMEAKDLIRRLLEQKPFKRIGVIKGGANTIKKHKWFTGFDWKSLEHGGTLSAPYIPKINGSEDLSNFEEYPEEENLEHYEQDGSNWDESF